MTIETVAGDVLIFSAAIGAISLVVKSLIENAMSKDVEKFKITISKELELYRSALEKDNFRFSKLHEKRAEVIIELYGKLVDFESALNTWICPLQFADSEKLKPSRQQVVYDTGKEFYTFYQKHRIFFTPEVCKLLDDLTTKLLHVRIEFETQNRLEGKDQTEVWMKAWKGISKDIPQLRSSIEDEFRSILGVNILKNGTNIK